MGSARQTDERAVTTDRHTLTELEGIARQCFSCISRMLHTGRRQASEVLRLDVGTSPGQCSVACAASGIAECNIVPLGNGLGGQIVDRAILVHRGHVALVPS